MTFREIWQQLVRKDSRLLDGDAKVEFTSSNLKKLLEQVYEQGQKSVPKSGGMFDDLSSMFGGKK